MKIQDNTLVKVTNEDIIDGKFTFPSGIVSIGDYAFHRCTSLQQIELPETLREIRACAFDGCTSLQQIILSEGLESIGNWAFWGCTSLQQIVLPASLQRIGNDAFRGCTSLNDVQGSNRELVNQVRLQALIGRKPPIEIISEWSNLANK